MLNASDPLYEFRLPLSYQNNRGLKSMKQQIVRRWTWIGILAIGYVQPARADVKLHPLFTDHMVLQRATSIPIWGTADPGETVHVRLERRLTSSWEAS